MSVYPSVRNDMGGSGNFSAAIQDNQLKFYVKIFFTDKHSEYNLFGPLVCQSFYKCLILRFFFILLYVCFLFQRAALLLDVIFYNYNNPPKTSMIFEKVPLGKVH